jgi:hypothetical protein
LDKHQKALFGAILLGSFLGFFISVAIFGTGYDLQRNDIPAGLIMLATMGGVYWFLLQLLGND